ncbi:type III-A CRISPR-associated RAMP protein Csm4, partial [Limosilactobacillus mucosae]|nr:type III-A CRISPR-associated RAMP protein Csm4 [Limosilactobacillus mucosae]
ELSRVMDGANYRLVKSSGFTYSPSVNEQLRKEDLYKFASGSVFSRRYQGSIVDVRPSGFAHPVWNYAKGMFYGLGAAK